jgi:hypothetical protein
MATPIPHKDGANRAIGTFFDSIDPEPTLTMLSDRGPRIKSQMLDLLSSNARFPKVALASSVSRRRLGTA